MAITIYRLHQLECEDPQAVIDQLLGGKISEAEVDDYLQERLVRMERSSVVIATLRGLKAAFSRRRKL